MKKSLELKTLGDRFIIEYFISKQEVIKVERNSNMNVYVNTNANTHVNVNSKIDTRLYFKNDSHITLNDCDFAAKEGDIIKILQVSSMGKRSNWCLQSITTGMKHDFIQNNNDFLEEKMNIKILDVGFNFLLLLLLSVLIAIVFIPFYFFKWKILFYYLFLFALSPLIISVFSSLFSKLLSSIFLRKKTLSNKRYEKYLDDHNQVLVDFEFYR